MNVDRGLGIIGALGVLGAIIAGFLGDYLAALITLGLIIICTFIWLVVKVISQTKELKQYKAYPKANMILEKYLDDTIWISKTLNNQYHITSEFLKWGRCTILINVLVPAPGRGLRNAPSNRYILGHICENTNDDDDRNFFGLRYSRRNAWEVDFTNANGERLADKKWLSIDEGLEEGWHQFMISWDRRKPELVFMIDGGQRGRNTSSRYLNYWPINLAENVTVGAWPNPYPESFVETKLSNLWICNQFLNDQDPLVIEHKAIFQH